MFINKRLYIVVAVIVVLLAGGYWWNLLFPVGQVCLFAFLTALVVDIYLLYSTKDAIKVERFCSDRFSNGDENDVRLDVESKYRFPISLEIIDEIPDIFQRRDVLFYLQMDKAENVDEPQKSFVRYMLRPTERGVYRFEHIRVFVSTRIGLIARRYTCGEPKDVKVYPSYLMLTKYELLAISNRLTEFGVKKIRKVGNNTEYEQIKEYVKGDEYRLINWKATARQHKLMVNVYQDERSQNIYNVIDKGRVMQQSFNGMSLLDYAINASLVLSYIAVRRDDKAGIVSFNEEFGTYVPASNRPNHMQTILEALYHEKTTFGETDFSALLANVNTKINKRSLLIVYTSFATVDSMKRQLPYLLQLNKRHRLLVVFFDDIEIKKYVESKTDTLEEYYRHVIAEKSISERKLIVSKLKEHGILSLLTTPEQLSVDVINKYLELKQRGMLT
ncbi:MAG: DUF58 domain-containing protein [Bacteroidaceae bacterium]|nr:DUF58 domain-containing protein [Bacteroidaceae bacterium]